LSRDEFYDSTLRELFREFVVAKRRTEDEADIRLNQAWNTANFVGLAFGGKLPRWESVKARIDAARLQMLEGRARMEGFSRTLGVPLRKASSEALEALQRMRERQEAAAHG
jgi:hypothetical protein